MEGIGYRVVPLPEAEEDILAYKKAGKKIALKRIKQIFYELEVHPETGIGKPEKLKHNYSGYWSREVDQKNRIIYKIHETEAVVRVFRTMYHYDDK